MAARSGLSESTIGRIWRAFGLQPHRTDTFKLSNDPLFVEKVYEIVGLYLNPPEAAVVLSVDEKAVAAGIDCQVSGHASSRAQSRLGGQRDAGRLG
jgi:hypothetical protein